MFKSKTVRILLLAGLSTMLVTCCAHRKPCKSEKVGKPTAAAAQAPVPDTPEVKIHEGKLENGLKILMLEDHSAPVVTVQVWYRVGSINERVGIRGLAHLAEHMMFKGSDNVGPEEHARIIDALGGSENAFTSEDVTAYHDTVPVDRMGLAMELEAERMARAKMDETHFFKEREVVKEEIRMRLQNDPIGSLLEKFRSIAYTKHPYNWTVAGTLEDLDAITLDDLKTFYKTFYAPNNAVLVVVGDAQFSKVMESAKKHFGSIPAEKSPPAVEVSEPAQKKFRREEVRFPTQLPIIIGGYKIPEARHQDSAVLEVIQFILGGGKSSRMHRSLVREKKIAVFAAGFNWKMKDPGLFLIAAGFIPMVPSKAVEEALMTEVDLLGQQGPTPDELHKAKSQLAAQYTFKLTSMWNVGIEIGMAELVEGDYRKFLEGASAYEKITAEDVKRVCNTYLKRDRLTLAVLLPPKAGEKVKKSKATKVEKAEKDTKSWPTAERFLNPEPASSDPVTLPKIAKKTLPNGLKLMAIERHEHPVVYFDLTVQGGGALDPRGQAGLTDLLAEMLTQGTKTRTAEQIAQEVESLGGGLSAHSDSEATSVNGRFLKRDFVRGLGLFADVSLNPIFPAEELARIRPQVEASVRIVKDKPGALARQHGTYLVYGYNHPRGRPTSIETLKAVTEKDLASVYQTGFQPQGSLLTVVGDLDAQQALDALEKAFGSWKKTGPVVELPKDPPQLQGRVVRLVDKPDLTQSTIAVGHLGISKLDPDYFNLLLGNYVLGGGGFSSRLMKNIRSKGGKTYGVRSWFAAGKTRGPFGASTFTRNSETANIIQMVLDEIAKVQKEGITDQELQAAKNNLAGSYAIRLQTPNGMANELALAEFYGLGEDWVRNYRKQVTKPTVAEVNQALAKHLDLKNLALVVVGKAAEVLDQVKKFGEPMQVNYLSPVPDEERKPEKPSK